MILMNGSLCHDNQEKKFEKCQDIWIKEKRDNQKGKATLLKRKGKKIPTNSLSWAHSRHIFVRALNFPSDPGIEEHLFL